MAVLGFLIYYINQCATSMTDANANTVIDHLEVCASFTASKVDFHQIIDALPTEAMTLPAW